MGMFNYTVGSLKSDLDVVRKLVQSVIGSINTIARNDNNQTLDLPLVDGIGPRSEKDIIDFFKCVKHLSDNREMVRRLDADGKPDKIHW